MSLKCGGWEVTVSINAQVSYLKIVLKYTCVHLLQRHKVDSRFNFNFFVVNAQTFEHSSFSTLDLNPTPECCYMELQAYSLIWLLHAQEKRQGGGWRWKVWHTAWSEAQTLSSCYQWERHEGKHSGGDSTSSVCVLQVCGRPARLAFSLSTSFIPLISTSLCLCLVCGWHCECPLACIVCGCTYILDDVYASLTALTDIL